MATVRRLLAVAALASFGALALSSGAGALPVPVGFPRMIAILHSTPQIHPTRFEVSTRVVGRKVRVAVRVAAAGIGGARKLVISVGPCTAGSTGHPLCKPTVSARVSVRTSSTDVTRSFLVARPAARHDALRVTLTPAGVTVPFQRNNVGGGGGMGEIVLNGGTWRFKQGTPWGIVVTEPAGLTIDQVKFNSHTHAWSGTAQSETPVSTQLGYEGETPIHVFANTMHAGKPFNFRRIPARLIFERRSGPRSYSFRADTGGRSLFSLRVPLPAWGGT